jgi:hypothetical protein
MLEGNEQLTRSRTKGNEILQFLKHLKKLPESLSMANLIQVDMPVLVEANERAEIVE